MGDKTQLATVALGARFGLPVPSPWHDTGMMLANVPAVLIGQRLAHRVPLDKMRLSQRRFFSSPASPRWYWAEAKKWPRAMPAAFLRRRYSSLFEHQPTAPYTHPHGVLRSEGSVEQLFRQRVLDLLLDRALSGRAP